jgi:hypothetical protein
MLAAARRAEPAPAAPAAEPGMLAAARARSPRGEHVELPLIGRVWIELPGDLVVAEIEAATRAEMKRVGLDLDVVTSLSHASHQLARTFAWAVRRPDAITERADTTEEWLAADPDWLNACGLVYMDVRNRLNPTAATLTQDQLDEIRLAHEKKNWTLLLSYGAVSLSSYLLTLAAPPASSPTTPSSTGESQ